MMENVLAIFQSKAFFKARNVFVLFKAFVLPKTRMCPRSLFLASVKTKMSSWSFVSLLRQK